MRTGLTGAVRSWMTFPNDNTWNRLSAKLDFDELTLTGETNKE